MELLLKMNGIYYIALTAKLRADKLRRHSYPLVLVIVCTHNSCDDNALCLVGGLINTENIYVLFLAVTAEKPLDIAVVYRIYYFRVLWVMRAYRSVNRHSDSLSDI